MDSIVPERIETDRLILRVFQDEDWRDLHEYYSDEIATRFTLPRKLSQLETWLYMCGMIGHWRIRGYGPYAVEEKVSGKVLGLVGFWYPNKWPSPEIKWALARQHWGKGFASEAARAVQRAGREYIPDISLISLIHQENVASINLAVAIGAKHEKDIQILGWHWQVWRHPNET